MTTTKPQPQVGLTAIERRLILQRLRQEQTAKAIERYWRVVNQARKHTAKG